MKQTIGIITAIVLGVVAILISIGAKGQPQFGSAETIMFNSTTGSSVAVPASGKNQILAGNSGRIYAAICNTDTTSGHFVYLNLNNATATASTGYSLAPSSCYEIKATNLYTGAVTGIAASGTSTVSTVEK